jgi:IPT/TIG domain/Kelch motif/Glucose / Sorbosone dehydrogenase
LLRHYLLDGNAPLNTTSTHTSQFNFLRHSCTQIVFHSNGKLYGTDNGPNTGFGDKSVNCTHETADPSEPDRVNVVLKGRYYGHPNRLRSQLHNDPRQCKWRSRSEASDPDYTAPIAHVDASTNGIVEWQTAHMSNQLRGQLFVVRHNKNSYTVKLSANGLGSIQVQDRGTGGLDVTQGPDGTLFIIVYSKSKVIFKKPIEPTWGDLRVLSCFPRRGPLSGDTRFRVYGQALDIEGVPQVTVGHQPCTNVIVISSSEIECTLPPALVPGRASVVVTSGMFTGVLSDVYRYATFVGGPPPAVDPVTSKWLTVTPTTPTKPLINHEGCFVMGNNDKAYLLGGRNKVNVCEYDPSTQAWTCTRQQPPIKLHHMQCVAVKDEIWIPTAWSGNYPNEVGVPLMYIYNVTANTWRTKPGLNATRQRGGAAAQHFNGSIYVSHGNQGGHGAHATSLAYFDRYDIATEQWTALPDAQFPRDHTGAAIVRGSWFCVAGGRDGGVDGFFNAVILQTECYDLLQDSANGVWTTKANITQGRAGSAYGTTCDGKLLVAGGEGFGVAWKKVDMYDFETNTWMQLDDLKKERHGTGLAVSCKCGGQVHIATGRPCQQGSCPELDTTETLFPNGVNVGCIAQNRRLAEMPESPSTSIRGSS